MTNLSIVRRHRLCQICERLCAGSRRPPYCMFNSAAVKPGDSEYVHYFRHSKLRIPWVKAWILSLLVLISLEASLFAYSLRTLCSDGPNIDLPHFVCLSQCHGSTRLMPAYGELLKIYLLSKQYRVVENV